MNDMYYPEEFEYNESSGKYETYFLPDYLKDKKVNPILRMVETTKNRLIILKLRRLLNKIKEDNDIKIEIDNDGNIINVESKFDEIKEKYEKTLKYLHKEERFLEMDELLKDKLRLFKTKYYPEGAKSFYLADNQYYSYFLPEELKNYVEVNLITLKTTKEQAHNLRLRKLLNYIEETNNIYVEVDNGKIDIGQSKFDEIKTKYEKTLEILNQEKRFEERENLLKEKLSLIKTKYHPRGFSHDMPINKYTSAFLPEELKGKGGTLINVETTKEQAHNLRMRQTLNYMDESNDITIEIDNGKLIMEKSKFDEIKTKYEKTLESLNDKKDYVQLNSLIGDSIRLLEMEDKNLKEISNFVKIKNIGTKLNSNLIINTIYYKEKKLNNNSNDFFRENIKNNFFQNLENDKRININYRTLTEEQKNKILEQYKFEEYYKELIKSIPKELKSKMVVEYYEQKVNLDNVLNGLNTKELQDLIKKREIRLSSMKQEENLSI